MSQKEVYEILKELGGNATTLQVKLRAREKFPGATLHTYVANRLGKLERNGYVKRIIADGVTHWEIIAKYT